VACDCKKFVRRKPPLVLHVDISWLFEPIMLCSLRISPPLTSWRRSIAGKQRHRGRIDKGALSSELSALSKQQFAALEKATFLGMTIEETVESLSAYIRVLAAGLPVLASSVAPPAMERMSNLEQIIGASRFGPVHEETRRRFLQKAATALYRPAI